jgi:hypothetical protein
MIKGAKGESVEEPEDLDKELALLKQKVKNVGQRIEVSKNKEILLYIFENSIEPLIDRFIEVCQKFDDFYIKTKFILFWSGGASRIPKDEAIANAKSQIIESGDAYEASLHYDFVNFRQTGFGDFDFFSHIHIKFELASYKISLGEDLKVYEKLYSEQLSQTEIEEIVKTVARLHKECIEDKIEYKISSQRLAKDFTNWLEDTKD